MEWNPVHRAKRLLLFLLAVVTLLPHSGCILVPAFYRGRMAPAACTELENKTIAVVCTSNASDFGPSSDAELVARRVSTLLAQNVKGAKVVAYQRVAAWMDEHDSQYIDYTEIGQDLNADLVVGIDIESFSLQSSATLYQGNALYHMEVVDVSEDRVVYETFTPPVVYPPLRGVPTTEATKEQFRRTYTDILGGNIARHFYEHDLNKLIATDTADLSDVR